jgi:NAD(P)-dependent dehydrogenase (short-subunit alcohol dehydrogenase family)
VRILVTGGTGRVGIAVVARLARAGHDLTVIGRTARANVPGAHYAQCDINDPAAMRSAAVGMDAIVHLAAIPGPISRSEEIFRVNCSGTFNLYEAAARAGIRRVVCISSINAFGYNFGTRTFPIRVLPIDESQKGCATDAYSFSKQVTERIADYAWRRDGISGVCLRLPYVAPEEFSERDFVIRHVALCRPSFESLMSLPLEQRQRRVAGWITEFNSWRAGRPYEKIEAATDYESPDPLMLGRTDFWTRIDCRDSAQAVEKSLRAEYDSCHVLFINDSHNFTGMPSLQLARLFFPEAAMDGEALSGTSTLVSIAAARALIGYEPEHSVGRWFGES